MSSNRPSLYTQNDVTEADARALLEAVSVSNTVFCHPAEVTLPATFQAAMKKGTPFTQEPDGTYDSRNTQLHRQQSVDKANLTRTMSQMGGQFGFRGNDKKK